MQLPSPPPRHSPALWPSAGSQALLCRITSTMNYKCSGSAPGYEGEDRGEQGGRLHFTPGTGGRCAVPPMPCLLPWLAGATWCRRCCISGVSGKADVAPGMSDPAGDQDPRGKWEQWGNELWLQQCSIVAQKQQIFLFIQLQTQCMLFCLLTVKWTEKQTLDFLLFPSSTKSHFPVEEFVIPRIFNQLCCCLLLSISFPWCGVHPEDVLSSAP